MVKDPQPLLLGATSVCSCPIRCPRGGGRRCATCSTSLPACTSRCLPPLKASGGGDTVFISIYLCSQAAAGKDISPQRRSNTTHAFKNLPGLSLSRVIASVTWPPLRAAPLPAPLPASDLMGCEAAQGGRRAGEGLYAACYFGSDSWRVFLLGSKLV